MLAHRSRFYRIVGAIITTLTIVVGIVFVVYTQSKINDRDLASWKKYRNTQHNFEILYPPTLKIDAQKDDSDPSFSIMLFNPRRNNQLRNGGGNISVLIMKSLPDIPERALLKKTHLDNIKTNKIEKITLKGNTGTEIELHTYVNTLQVGEPWGYDKKGNSLKYILPPERISAKLISPNGGEEAYVDGIYPNVQGVTIDESKTGFRKIFINIIQNFNWLP